jgi:hypothetical protein
MALNDNEISSKDIVYPYCYLYQSENRMAHVSLLRKGISVLMWYSSSGVRIALQYGELKTIVFPTDITETGKSRVHTTPTMVIFFFDRKISLASGNNNITINYSGSHISR